MEAHSQPAYPLLSALARTSLAAILEENYGRKDVAIEDALMRPLDCLGAMAVFKQHNVNKIYLLPRDGSPLQWGACTTCRVYVLRPTLRNAAIVAQHWRAQRSSNSDPLAPQHSFTCVFWPRRSHAVEQYFEQHGVYGEIKTVEFNPCFLSLDDDLLSMELPDFFPDTFLHGTSVHNYALAKALWQLQYLYGPINRTYCVGAVSESILALVDRIKEQLGEPRLPAASGCDDQGMGGELVPPPGYLFVFDRSIDYTSVLATCLSYENLLNETFGITCGVCDLPQEVLEKMTQADQVVKSGKLHLNNKDEVFSEVRDRHVTAVFPYLAERTRHLQQLATKAQSVHSASVAELKQFVATELKGARSLHRHLEVHMSAAEVMQARWAGLSHRLTNEKCAIDGSYFKEIASFLEESLMQPRPNSCNLDLALLCLASLRLDGLPSKDYQHFRRLFLHAHGFEKLTLWHNLAKMGILFEKGTASETNTPTGAALASICKQLVLVPSADLANGINLKQPTDMSYVFNAAYTPVACSVLAQCLQNGFEFQTDNLSRLFNCPAKCVDTTSRRLAPGQNSTLHAIQSTHRPVIMVLFVGGVTHAEIAALRLLGKMRGYKIVIACTNIIGRKQFFELIGPTAT